MVELLTALTGALLFIAGIYTGIWIQRHSREVIEREVPRVVVSEKVIVQPAPMPAPPAPAPYIPPAPKPAPQLPSGGPVTIGAIKPVNSQLHAEEDRMRNLIRETNPEVL